MKRVILLMLILLFFTSYQTFAGFEFENPGVGFGFAAGGAMGDNSSADKWVLQYRGYFQYKLISPVLLGQLGLGYTKLDAPNDYSAETIVAENRFLFIPFSLEKLNPFLYGGFGLTYICPKMSSKNSNSFQINGVFILRSVL